MDVALERRRFRKNNQLPLGRLRRPQSARTARSIHSIPDSRGWGWERPRVRDIRSNKYSTSTDVLQKDLAIRPLMSELNLRQSANNEIIARKNSPVKHFILRWRIILQHSLLQ